MFKQKMQEEKSKPPLKKIIYECGHVVAVWVWLKLKYSQSSENAKPHQYLSIDIFLGFDPISKLLVLQ